MRTITKIIKLLTVSSMLLISSYMSINAQVIPNYWGSLKKGVYAVGFKSFCIFDSTRAYDLTFGDSTYVLKNSHLGRPVLLNMWYPTKPSKSNKPLQIRDFFDFSATDDTRQFMTKLKDYQLVHSKEAIDANLPKKSFASDSLVTKIREQLFETYLSSNTLSFRDAERIKTDFPVIIYHQGLGGTIDDNFLLLEYLASNGYIVINSAFQNSDAAWTLNVGDRITTYKDFNFIIEHLKKINLLKKQKVFLMGHSYGANSSIAYLGEGYKNIDGIIPIDSDLSYLLHFNFSSTKEHLFKKEKLKYYDVPIFCIARSEAIFRLTDSFTTAKRYYLNIPNMEHNDFIAQGAIGRYYAAPYLKDKANQYEQAHGNYLKMCTIILQFLEVYTKAKKPIDLKSLVSREHWRFEIIDPNKKLASNTLLEESKNKCPTVSQWLDILLKGNFENSKKEYFNCSDSLLFKKRIDIAVALYYDADIGLTLQYLNWLYEMGSIEKDLAYLFDMGTDFMWIGKEDLKPKAHALYQWMIEKYPKNRFGYLGMILTTPSDDKVSLEKYCKMLLEIYPNYETIIGNNFWGTRVMNNMNYFLKRKSNDKKN